MAENNEAAAAEAESPATPTPPRRPGHRAMDPRETVAELTAKAHEISLEAGSKVAAAMKNVIGAAAGLTGFAVESARDLVQYMVRRGQMTQDEGDKLMREVDAAHKAQNPAKSSPAKSSDDGAKAKRENRPAAPREPAPEKEAAAKPAKTKNDAPKDEKPKARKAAAEKTAAKAPAKKAAKKAAATNGKAATKNAAAKRKK